MINWYEFNIGTLLIDIVITLFSLFTLFSALEERKKTKRLKEKMKYGVKK